MQVIRHQHKSDGCRISFGICQSQGLNHDMGVVEIFKQTHAFMSDCGDEVVAINLRKAMFPRIFCMKYHEMFSLISGFEGSSEC